MLLYSPTLAAQEKKTTIEEEKVPFYQGTTIGVDIFGLGSKIFGGDITSTEISVEVNLKNRYVPVAEIGYGTTDTTDDGTNIHYKASAPYFRIGMNYNFFFKKPYLPGFLYGGIRYGFTSFSYDVDAPTMKDPTWGFPEIPFSYVEILVHIYLYSCQQFGPGYCGFNSLITEGDFRKSPCRVFHCRSIYIV